MDERLLAVGELDLDALAGDRDAERGTHAARARDDAAGGTSAEHAACAARRARTEHAAIVSDATRARPDRGSVRAATGARAAALTYVRACTSGFLPSANSTSMRWPVTVTTVPRPNFGCSIWSPTAYVSRMP